MDEVTRTMLIENIAKPFIQIALGLEKAIDPKLAGPLMEFFTQIINASFDGRKSLLNATVSAEGNLYCFSADGAIVAEQSCPLAKNPESLREIANLMVSMVEGTSRALRNLEK